MTAVNVFDQRRENEIEFVRAALVGITRGVIEADAVLAVCPPYALGRDFKAQGIYSAIAALSAQHERVDIVNVAKWLHNSKDNRRSITPADVADFCELSILGSSEESILSLAATVRQEGVKAKAEFEFARLMADCQRYGNDPAEIATGAVKVAEALENGCSDPADYSLAGIMDRVVDKLASGIAAQPLPTPWDSLNRVLRGGLVPGELAVLAARPGMGKTALAGCLAVDVARLGKPALFISREVKDETVAARMLSREARIDLRYFRQGIGNAPAILPKIREAQSTLKLLPLSIVERSVQAMTPREVRRLAKGIRGVGLIVVDYLQLMLPDEKSNSREREVAEMSRAFKQLALDCDCPVLLLSQLNRSSETANRAPELSDLRESGAIEQDADIVMFLHTDRRYQRDARMLVKLIVAKGRSSGTGATWMEFNKPFADFVETQEPSGMFATRNDDNGL